MFGVARPSSRYSPDHATRRRQHMPFPFRGRRQPEAVSAGACGGYSSLAYGGKQHDIVAVRYVSNGPGHGEVLWEYEDLLKP